MDLRELILDDEDSIGVEAISVVENPAIESDFIALSKQNIQLAEVNKFLKHRKCIYKMVINLTQL